MPHFPPFLAKGLTGVGWMLIDKASIWEMGSLRGSGASPGSWEWGPPTYTGGPAWGAGGAWAVGQSFPTHMRTVQAPPHPPAAFLSVDGGGRADLGRDSKEK